MIRPPRREPHNSESAMISAWKLEAAENVLGDRHCLKRPFLKPGSPAADRAVIERNAHVNEAVRRIINSWSGA